MNDDYFDPEDLPTPTDGRDVKAIRWWMDDIHATLCVIQERLDEDAFEREQTSKRIMQQIGLDVAGIRSNLMWMSILITLILAVVYFGLWKAS